MHLYSAGTAKPDIILWYKSRKLCVNQKIQGVFFSDLEILHSNLRVIIEKSIDNNKISNGNKNLNHLAIKL